MDAYALAGPLLRRLDPERAHDLTLWALRHGLVSDRRQADDPILASRHWGLDFPNPIGLAAGFDKNAAVIGPMLGLGFGLVEVGSVTPRPQAGNPKPRIFRLPDSRAVINRLGFNNRGVEAAAANLRAWRSETRPGRVGVNIGKNKDSEDAVADYATAAAALGSFADYLVINVSSPNTPGLRALQGREELERIVAGVRAALPDAGDRGRLPLLVKVAPDLGEEDLADIAAVACGGALDGLIATNTTVARPAGLDPVLAQETGGLSGEPLFEPATAVLRELARLTEGTVLLVGVGGVATGAQAYAKIRAGASLVQLYTGLIYRGPGLVKAIKEELAACLRRDGFASLAEAVGADLR